MHTVGNKISARERELAPRYYYKIEQSRTCIEKIKAFFRALLTFMFTQVGVVVLVVTYMIIGAVIFEHLEGESQMEVAVEALEVRKLLDRQQYRIGLIMTYTDMLLLSETFPKLQCECGLGVKKCMGAIHRKIHEESSLPISRACFTPGITWIENRHDNGSKQKHFPTAQKPKLCKVSPVIRTTHVSCVR